MKLIDLKCPYCGAPLTVRATDRTARCEYCRSTFAVEREQPAQQYRPAATRTPTPQTKKKITGILVWMLVFAIIFPVTLFGMGLKNSFWPHTQSDTPVRMDHAYRTVPVSSPMQRFVQEVFRKDLEDITAEEYASIRYLSIDNTDMSELCWIFEYAFSVDENGEPADAKKILLSDENEVEYKDLECFPGLVSLNCNNCYELTGSGSGDWSFGNMPDLKYLHGGFNQSPGELENRLADAAQIEYLQLHCYGENELEQLTHYTGLKTLYLDYVNEDVTDFSALTQMTWLETLEISLSSDTAQDISGISEMTNLTGLAIGGTPAEYRFLKNMPQLTSLEIGAASTLKDISFLQSLPALKSLTLSNTALIDISPLSQCTGLTTLRLVNNSGITDYSALAGLTGLETLTLTVESKANVPNLAACTGLKNVYVDNTAFQALAGVQSIETLGVSVRSGGIDAAQLAGMHSLASLSLSGDSNVYNVRTLQELPALTKMTLSGSPDFYSGANDDWDAQYSAVYLFQIPSLRELDLEGESYGTGSMSLDLSRMQDNSTLQTLKISGITYWYQPDTEYTSLGAFSDEFLRHFTGLQSLSATGMEIRDVSFAEAMPELREIYLEDNYVQDLTPLQALEHLEIADLTNNPIPEDSTLAHGYLVGSGV